MNTAAGSAKAMLQRLHARDVARLLWVFATVLYADDPLVNKMSEVACEMVDFNTQDIANMLWACARLQICGPLLIQSQLRAAEERVKIGRAHV